MAAVDTGKESTTAPERLWSKTTHLDEKNHSIEPLCVAGARYIVLIEGDFESMEGATHSQC